MPRPRRARAPDDLLPLADLGCAPRRAGRRRERRCVRSRSPPTAGRAAVPRRLRLRRRPREREVGEHEAAARGSRTGARRRSRIARPRSSATELERLLQLRAGPDLPTDFRPVNTSVISFPTRTVRATGRDRRGLELRASAQHARRQRRRPRRPRHERRRVDGGRDAAHRSRQLRSPRATSTPASAGSSDTGRASTLILDQVSKQLKVQQGRHDRHAGNARPPLSGPLSVRHPDRPRAHRRAATTSRRSSGAGASRSRTLDSLDSVAALVATKKPTAAVTLVDGVKAAALLFVAAIVRSRSSRSARLRRRPRRPARARSSPSRCSAAASSAPSAASSPACSSTPPRSARSGSRRSCSRSPATGSDATARRPDATARTRRSSRSPS